MPVTAKLSRKFYEQLGDEITGELVDWFNSVDADYQSQLRLNNDLNWERFKAELHAVEDKLRGEFNVGMAKLEASIRADMAEQLAGIRGEIAKLEASIHEVRSEVMKWMFIYWTGTMLTLGGLILALRP